MGTRNELVYIPRWHEVGDPDNLAYAVAYGVIALASIWVLESLAERILFSAGLDIPLSDVAALVVFKGSSWLDIMRWMFFKGKTENYDSGNTRSTRRKINPRAIAGILFRLAVILLDISIVFASIPRQISVYENGVGSTQISFKNGSRLALQEFGDSFVGKACNRDKILYAGFSPTAVRYVCMLAAILPQDLATTLPRNLSSFPKGTEIYGLTYSKSHEMLHVSSLRSRTTFSFIHVIHVDDEKTFSKYKTSTFRLPIPKDIVTQVVTGLKWTYPKSNRICRARPGIRAGGRSFRTVLLVCIPTASERIELGTEIPVHLLNFLGTSKVKPQVTLTKQIGHNNVVKFYPQVGTINRPRICIYPALIILALLIISYILFRSVAGSENLVYNLWKLSNEVAQSSNSGNPMLAERRIAHLNFVPSRRNFL